MPSPQKVEILISVKLCLPILCTVITQSFFFQKKKHYDIECEGIPLD